MMIADGDEGGGNKHSMKENDVRLKRDGTY